VSDVLLFSVATFRDWVIIFMGIAVAAFFTVAMILAIVLGLLSRMLLKKSISTLDDNVKPLLGSAKQTADSVKGTATFVSDAAVQPIIRTYGVIAGVRRAAGVLAGLTGADGEKPKA
jgi:divalent metal cation (Fe/Co/Zn/Cd) transporter